MKNIKIHYIYTITNTCNFKVYVGYTSRSNPISRWLQHLSNAKTINRPLYYAMRKYGTENFIFSVIYCSTDADHTLKTMESYFISQYNSFIEENGYNLTRGGESNFGWMPSENTRTLWRSQRIGRVVTLETREKKRQITQSRFQDNPQLREQYRITALNNGSRPPRPTLEANRKSATTRTGGHIHTKERKLKLSIMVADGTHNFCDLEAREKRKQTWKMTGRGRADKNGNAAFASVYDSNGELLMSGLLSYICEKYNLPFKKFLAARRHGNQIQRGAWKGWRVESIERSSLK